MKFALQVPRLKLVHSLTPQKNINKAPLPVESELSIEDI